MDNTLASIFGRPRPITVGERTYQIYPTTIGDLADLQAWVDRQFPSPFDVVEGQINKGRLAIDEDGNPCRVPYTTLQKKVLYELALGDAEKKHPIGTDEADRLLNSVDGLKEIFYLSVRKGDPTFTRDDADRAFRQFDQAQMLRVVSLSGMDQVMTAPKAGGPDGTPTTPSPARPETPPTGGASSE